MNTITVAHESCSADEFHFLVASLFAFIMYIILLTMPCIELVECTFQSGEVVGIPEVQSVANEVIS